MELALLTNIVAQNIRVMKEFQPHQINVRDDLVYPDVELGLWVNRLYYGFTIMQENLGKSIANHSKDKNRKN